MNVTANPSTYNFNKNHSVPTEKPKSKIIFVPNANVGSSNYKTPKLQDLRSAFLLKHYSRVEDMGKAQVRDTDLSHTNDWHAEAKEGQYPWAVTAASVFVNDIQPPTQDRVLTNRDLNPDILSPSKSKNLYNQVFNEFKKDFVHCIMNLTYHHASKLDDGDLIKDSLLIAEEKNKTKHESLMFNYAYLDNDGERSKIPCGMFITNMNKPEEKWILNFGGEISKVDVRPECINVNEHNNSSMLIKAGGNLYYGKEKYIGSGDLKDLIIRKCEDNIESKRNIYRGEEAFDNSKLSAFFHGLKKGITNSLCCPNFWRSVEADDLDAIHESARQLGEGIGKAAPSVVVGAVAGLATGGAGAALVGGAATALMSAGVNNAGALNSAYNAFVAKK